MNSHPVAQSGLTLDTTEYYHFVSTSIARRNEDIFTIPITVQSPMALYSRIGVPFLAGTTAFLNVFDISTNTSSTRNAHNELNDWVLKETLIPNVEYTFTLATIGQTGRNGRGDWELFPPCIYYDLEVIFIKITIYHNSGANHFYFYSTG